MKRFLALVFLIVLAAFAARSGDSPQPHHTAANKTNVCDGIMPHIKKVIPPAITLGVISKYEDMEMIYVRERLWQDAGPDIRQGIAMTAFCSAHVNGIGGSQVRSHETGKTLVRVRDGRILE